MREVSSSGSVVSWPKLDARTEWAAKLKEAQAAGARAAKEEHAGSFDQAFASYIKAAQGYLFLIRHTADPAAKAKLRETSKGWVDRAERIKQAKKDLIRPIKRDRLQREEQDAVVERSTTISGARYERWTTQDQQPRPSPKSQIKPPLSTSQLSEGATWRRQTQVPVARPVCSGKNIVQDNVSDCSLVAALIVAAEHHTKFGSKYMQLCGGYEFRGSNSSIDFAALTGWIPEHVSLRGSSYRSEPTWKRIYEGYLAGRCVLTIGTSKPGDEGNLPSGLVPSHNYAVVGMTENEGRREVQFMNPWRPQASTEFVADLQNSLPHINTEPLAVNWDVISLHFESLYVNWDPAMFAHSDSCAAEVVFLVPLCRSKHKTSHPA
ncbi:calcium-dependent cysteine-type endopeptidase [Pseudohyphozyma bogoriensis]|nr:calcium-dependent cysteine-type endopeptidase [Pseudohyphozyma bogoriensis]